MKAISLISILVFGTSCVQAEVKPITRPSVEITKVTGGSVEFLVSNNSSTPFFYLGWCDKSPLATSEVKRGDSWKLSYFVMCGTGSDFFLLEPGQSFRSTIPNYNQGAMRVVLGFSEEANFEFEGSFVVRSELFLEEKGA